MKLLVKDIEILIDEWNLDLIRDYGWWINNWGYLQVYIDGKMQYLHRMIAERMGLDCSEDIDHIDRNKLNNQQENLRSATCSQNAANSKKYKNNTSGYKGVTKCGNKWRARIRFQGKEIHLGYFNNIEDAARTYDKAALKYFGEFARLNFPRSDYSSDLSFEAS